MLSDLQLLGAANVKVIVVMTNVLKVRVFDIHNIFSTSIMIFMLFIARRIFDECTCI